MRNIFITAIVMCLTQPICLFAQKDKSLMAVSEDYNWTSWGNNRLPKECRLPLSKDFGGISFTGRYATYTNADTWYIISSTDGKLYSCYTDGSVNGEGAFSPKPRGAKIDGTDPLNLQVNAIGKLIEHNGNDKIANRFGRYPSAQLMYNDIWYYGTYLLEQNDRSLYVPNFDWPILQPFVGFRVSDNFGESWYDQTTPEDPLLENYHDKWINAHGVEFNPYEVMIGAPHFVDFGQNLKYAPTDEKTGRKWAYMVAHGADAKSELAHNSWVSGDNIYLLRILMPEGRNKEENFRYINNPANWQYLSRNGTYRAWNRDNLEEVYSHIRPIVDATGFMGNVGLTYNAPLRQRPQQFQHTDSGVGCQRWHVTRSAVSERIRHAVVFHEHPIAFHLRRWTHDVAMLFVKLWLQKQSLAHHRRVEIRHVSHRDNTRWQRRGKGKEVRGRGDATRGACSVESRYNSVEWCRSCRDITTGRWRGVLFKEQWKYINHLNLQQIDEYEKDIYICKRPFCR